MIRSESNWFLQAFHLFHAITICIQFCFGIVVILVIQYNLRYKKQSENVHTRKRIRQGVHFVYCLIFPRHFVLFSQLCLVNNEYVDFGLNKYLRMQIYVGYENLSVIAFYQNLRIPLTILGSLSDLFAYVAIGSNFVLFMLFNNRFRLEFYKLIRLKRIHAGETTAQHTAAASKSHRSLTDK